MNDLSDISEFGSVAQAAKLFDCGERAVRSGIKNGTIPHVRLGTAYRIPLRMMVEHLAEQVAGTDATDFGPLEVAS